MSNLSENQMVGGWSTYRSLTPVDQEVFNEAMNGFVGVHYVPTSVSSQIVNGTNYRFKCTASIPPAEVIWEAIVEIFKPIDGIPHITGITRL
jgi:hypothetical protein